MAWSFDWDETSPAVGDAANLIHNYIQTFKKAVRERANVEHDATDGDNTDTWVHKQGSARITCDVAANRPAASSDEADRVYFATDTGVLSACLSDGSAWVDIVSAVYSTGTVDVTNGDATVSGTGTDFTKCAAGDVFWIDGGTRYYAIDSITNGTELELTVDYEGSTDTGKTYYIGRMASDPHWLPRAGGSWFEGKLGSALDANSKKITGLAAHSANGDAVRYEHTTSNPIDHADASITAAKLAVDVAEWAVGSYAGTGSTTSVTGLGFKPDLVIIQTVRDSDSAPFAGICWGNRDIAHGSPEYGALIRSWDSGVEDTDFRGAIQYDADGFTLKKNDAQFNAAGYTHHYIALKLT